MAREFAALLQSEVGMLYLRVLELVTKLEALTEENAALKAATGNTAEKDAQPE